MNPRLYSPDLPIGRLFLLSAICYWLLAIGCSAPTQPPPTQTKTNTFHLPTAEITVDAILSFDAPPSADLQQQLLNAGASLVPSPPTLSTPSSTLYYLPSIDSDQKRAAITAALSAGATLVSSKKP